MGFHENSLGHRAWKDQGVEADFLGAMTEARAVRSLQTKCAGASRSDGVGGCWGSPLGGGVPQGVLGRMGALVVPQTGPIRSSPPKVPAGGWGS